MNSLIRLGTPAWRALSNRLAVLLIVLALASSLATWGALTQQPFFGHDPTTVTILLTLDLVFLILLGALVAGRIIAVWKTRRGNQTGSRLHIRMVRIFTLLAAAPALAVALSTLIFFYFGVETWFSARVRTAINESQEIAQAYLEEHQQVLRADALAMANDLNRRAFLLQDDPLEFSQFVAAQADVRSLTEAIVFDGTGRILARSALSFALSFEPVPEEMRARARQGEVVLVVSDTDDRVRALVRLDTFVDTYLFVGRPVDPQVLTRMAHTEQAVQEYNTLRDHSGGLRTRLALIFTVLAILLMLAAVWFGLNFATRLARPISALIDATERMRQGDLSARVAVPEDAPHAENELVILSAAFNRMADQLAAQRTELIEANQQLDERHRFTEAVLAGVSAGVVGLDSTQTMTLVNAAASAFFGTNDPRRLHGKTLASVAPELAALIATMPPDARFHDDQVEIRRPGKVLRTLFVRVAMLSHWGEGTHGGGYVVTFDDLSALVAAQRKAAWGDVARRIAHEIRNPLTPIQLAAGRLQRKYQNEIQTDPEIFNSCLDTIIRHVDDIGRMVQEFSTFARMPAPVLQHHDVRDLVRHALFAQATGRPDVDYTHSLPEAPCLCECDGRQIVQALTNILKNAAESIDAECKNTPHCARDIAVILGLEEGHITITVRDTGTGLPPDRADRLTEPYVTTRSKGTGLGLAIVRKIMEDHGGTILLADRVDGLKGAEVVLKWPRTVHTKEFTKI